MPSATPSITYWNRLEPRPRAPRISETLAAAIRDPLWMLARQWQFAEFQGEDTGSPAAVELRVRLSPFLSWRPPGGAALPLPAGQPLEPTVQAEPFTPDLTTRVELGHTFLALLAERLAPATMPVALRDAFRAAYPIRLAPAVRRLGLLFSVAWDLQAADPAAGGVIAPALLQAFHGAGIELPADSSITAAGTTGPWVVTDAVTGTPYLVPMAAGKLEVHLAAIPDRDAALFRLVCADRAVDGVALHQAALTAPQPPPLNDPALPAAQRAAAALAIDDLHIWVTEVFGVVGTGDPAAWRADRLEYSLEVLAPAANGDTATLGASPDRDGDFDWYAFDLRSQIPGGNPTQVRRISQTVFPAHVRFRGMPNARWWDFEHAGTDFGAVVPDSRDLAKLVVMDFMLVHGNDWFMLPFDQPVGSLCNIDGLLVHDVFGQTFLIPRADAAGTGSPPKPEERWTMFSTTAQVADASGRSLADFFLLPPSVGTAAQPGPTVEEVRFLRDECANMIWAVEHTTENGVGEPWPGHERDLAVKAAQPPTDTGSRTDGPPLHYLIQTTTPEHWIPFLPVAVDPARGTVALERAAMLSGAGGLTGPAGRLLTPTVPIWEEEVPRTGVTVLRVPVRSRWLDGSTHLWISRRTVTGTGEASSGLAFDQVVPLSPG